MLINSRAPKLPFLRAIPIVLSYSHPLANPIIPNRLTKAVLPCLINLLSSESDAKPLDEPNGSTSGRKKGKKRARGYEGDEVFKTRREVLCPTAEEGDIVIAAAQGKPTVSTDDHVHRMYESSYSSTPAGPWNDAGCAVGRFTNNAILAYLYSPDTTSVFIERPYPSQSVACQSAGGVFGFGMWEQ
jgi:hypothetical protein